MPEEFYDLVSHHLPPEQPVGPRGGRPPVGHRTVLRVLWFVLATGARWEDVPPEMGCSGRTAHRRLQRWEGLGIWDRLHADLLRLLRQADRLDPDLVIVEGTKHTLLVDRHGVPLAIRTAGANASDHTQIIPAVLEFPHVGGQPGRPKELPDELYADRGYDSDATRWILAWLGIEPHIARRKTPHGSGLGKVRWVVERTISWLKGLRRMRIRYDRLGVIQDAWTTLAASVICFRLLHEDEPLAA
jgi:transposase